MRRSQHGLIIAIAACFGTVIVSVLWRRSNGLKPSVEPVSTVALPNDGDQLTELEEPELTTTEPEASQIDRETRASAEKVPEPFDLRKYRSTTIQRLHKHFAASKQDSPGEWRAGYTLMQDSPLAHLDHIGAFTQDDGTGLVSQSYPGWSWMYSNNRGYLWRDSDYPEFTEMTELRQNSSRVKLRLTVSQRQAIADLYALARSELAGR